MNIHKVVIIAISFLAGSCTKFLDAKPDKKLVVPSTLADLQAFLDNDIAIANNWPNEAEVASDNYYISDADWDPLSSDSRSAYVWDSSYIPAEARWSNMYIVVFKANTALEHIDKVSITEGSSVEDYNTVKGNALFLRAFSFFQAAQIFSPPYNKSTADKTPGIAIRLTSDINAKTTRATLQQTYDQIINDLKQAAILLPLVSTYKTRASAAAAYALLARTYLCVGSFEEAAKAADSSLKYQNALLDYSKLNASATVPISNLNEEVIYYAKISVSLSYGATLRYTVARVDTMLYKSYSNSDLRKAIFFGLNGDNSNYFKGNYDGYRTYSTFNGLATDEVYLIKAECAARSGNIIASMGALNTLLQTRWIKADFVPFTASSSQQALELVLTERRKELCFRGGLRWMDIRRLNQESDHAITLQRKVGNTVYELKPGDVRFAFNIPTAVIEMTGISQNDR